MSAGGGSKRLFRKVDDRSSEFYPRVNELRKQGSYIYEEFLNTQGTDVKVYTVGADYGHAEARKSPVIDGRVHRDDAGLEVRYPVILKANEKKISRDITLAFKQTVCGFDFLRVQGKSYVCDVNGWSFVKKNRKYYDDCSRILAETLLHALRPEYHSTLSTTQPLMLKLKNRTASMPIIPVVAPVPTQRTLSSREFLVPSSPSPARDPSPAVGYEDEEELLCVISVIRHGDRTPKQKMKLRVWDPRYLDYYHEHSPSAKKNLKLKSRAHLLEFLDVTKNILAEGKSKWYGNDASMFVKLQRVRDVLEQHEITGVNRKMQMKPERWAEVVDVGPNGEVRKTLRASHIQVILKWGGVLTPLGEKQAEELGAMFRSAMYPDPTGGGVLRLHSTFRHDLKIKASDEGRVMKTAAAFTKGLLELEGGLTPVLVSLVTVQVWRCVESGCG
jgi:inositol-hexakisphosphate/diphosphoinositol-pentakisphosphate 1-kinase